MSHTMHDPHRRSTRPVPPRMPTASTRARATLVVALLVALAAPAWPQLNPIEENKRRLEQAEAERKRAEREREEAQRRQQQAERDKAQAVERARRAEEELARLKALQGTAPAPAPAAAKPLPAPADPYPMVDGLPPERVKELQQVFAASLGVGVEFADRLRDGREGPKLLVIPAGRFTMGSESGDPDEKPPHPRRVDAFALMKTEVTVGQYLACVAAGGCREPEWRQEGSKYHYQTGSSDLYRRFGAALTDANSPVVGVNWENARQYAAWLTAQTGKRYRLASEAEWEYGARSGATGRWSFGDDESKLGRYARFVGNSQARMWAVGGREANAWGLHDMHGNVWEWVQDCWHEDYRGAPETGEAWEAGCADTRRVSRGGSSISNAGNLRSAIRNASTLDYRYYSLGFRLARTL